MAQYPTYSTSNQRLGNRGFSADLRLARAYWPMRGMDNPLAKTPGLQHDPFPSPQLKSIRSSNRPTDHPLPLRDTASEMKTLGILTALLTFRASGAAAKEIIHATRIETERNGSILTPQNNYNGWVNPEDLISMPQCIAQQDQSTWLDTMTKCTSKQCTSHFGIICTHHQWLTQLSCLSTEVSPDLVRSYLPYCGRSVLAKAQLYRWIRNLTGRTWLVDVGDANGLEDLSPASLARGYATVSLTEKAPTCLRDSVSTLSMEPFQRALASCSFTSTSQHTGNAARPWEYRESVHSMVALDFETVGYDLTRRVIGDGDYFDIECLCSAFVIDFEKEPCSEAEAGQLELTKERLWIHATCGPNYLPDNWTDRLKTTEYAFIPIENWHWPKCYSAMPKQVTELVDQCATDACELDAGGYCKVKPTVDRACFCHHITYDSCGGSCQIFETRIDYVRWLHNLCGGVPDWDGLPDNWQQLAAPTTLDMIPWGWTVKPSNVSDNASSETVETCVSNERKLGSFALVNVVTFLAEYLGLRTVIRLLLGSRPSNSHSGSWISMGASIAALQLLANFFNASLVQKTLGYEAVPVIHLTLLWCSMPRLTWLTILLTGVKPSTAMSSLLAEIILQIFSVYHMALTVIYGLEHNFYFGGLKNAERGQSAQIMYIAALQWVILVGIGVRCLERAIRGMNGSTEPASLDSTRCRRSRHQLSKGNDVGESLLTGTEGGDNTLYGTFPVQRQHTGASQRRIANLFTIVILIVHLLWVVQWLFWSGFIALSSEEFCPPRLGVLTAVWVAFSLAGVTVEAFQVDALVRRRKSGCEAKQEIRELELDAYY